LVRHVSIAVSELLPLLPAAEPQAPELLALASTSLSLFPKASFTATQTGDCLHVTLPETRGIQQVQHGEQHGTEILAWGSFKAFPLSASRELKLTRQNNLTHMKHIKLHVL